MRQKSKNWTESSSREHRSISCCSKSLANFNRAKALNWKSFNHRTRWSQNNTKTQKGTSLSTSRAFENCTRSLSDFKSSSINWKLKDKLFSIKYCIFYIESRTVEGNRTPHCGKQRPIDPNLRAQVEVLGWSFIAEKNKWAHGSDGCLVRRNRNPQAESQG